MYLEIISLLLWLGSCWIVGTNARKLWPAIIALIMIQGHIEIETRRAEVNVKSEIAKTANQ